MKLIYCKRLPVFLFAALISCNGPIPKQENPKDDQAGIPLKEEKQVAVSEMKEELFEEEKVSSGARLVGEDEIVYKYDLTFPASWKRYEIGEKSLDYCNYEITLPDGYKMLTVDVLLNTRFDADNIKDLYEAALKSKTLYISYKLQKDNWFVISGIDRKTKNIVYWKRVFGEMYVGDLRFEYSKSKEAEIAPYIGMVAKSFTCD